ncbi:Clp protease ClpP [Staphylococcus pseudintermedius]|nr:head maturation protease, ClpP-related [Staphylococcus pseudintermedius]YP_009823300.1 head maturation protease [Staphylococcus phage vB_SpsS_QT1]AZB66727.1 Clp protease-like protein [Staphylococcus phage phiSP119-1]EGQ0290627.1 Clp protease ClpP [Staphylococcus pseudintermedius]EGQ2753779.1 Clp protease ClpP [Staphylococcus pseudintermedius]EGQ3041188.1 Clp protease ClpP [Staphylococcus pseudintermedius]EGQ3068735.1 Clp protease ClpP [Staphylococcus pseudintermedius]
MKSSSVIPHFKNEVSGDTQILTLNGVVASDDFENTISHKKIEAALKGSDKNIVIKLASGGGDAFEGINIYNYLKSLKNHVTIEITSIAASAASIIAMAGDKIVMHTGSNMMIHEASTFAFGSKTDIRKTLNALESVDKSIVDVYYNRTGVDKNEIIDMMAKETWMTADEAIKQKFADEKWQSKEVTNMDKRQLLANLKEQQKLLAQMIAETSGNGSENEEPDNDDSLEQRLADLENDVKNIKLRLDDLEGSDDKEDSDTPKPPEPQNKFKRFSF